MEEAIESIPVLEQSIESSKKDLAEVSAPYYESMENRQIDELLTGLALKHGLFPVSLSIDGAEAALPGQPALRRVTGMRAARQPGQPVMCQAASLGRPMIHRAAAPEAYRAMLWRMRPGKRRKTPRRPRAWRITRMGAIRLCPAVICRQPRGTWYCRAMRPSCLLSSAMWRRITRPSGFTP